MSILWFVLIGIFICVVEFVIGGGPRIFADLMRIFADFFLGWL